MKVFEMLNIPYNTNDKKLGEMFFLSKMKARKKFNKKQKKKETTIKGEYCPKEKPGQSWSHIKDTRKDDELDREDVE